MKKEARKINDKILGAFHTLNMEDARNYVIEVKNV